MKGIDEKEALALLECQGKEAYALLARANQARIETKGFRIELCGVINAKSGMCSENCKFCPQSVHSDSAVDCYPLVSDDKIIDAAAQAARWKACRLGIVTSGERIQEEEEIETIINALTRMKKETGISPCASLGIITPETMKRFKDAGLTRYHCNIETAKSFFDHICSTHSWEDSVNTIKTAKSLGLTTCSGGIFGLGESLSQRVEMLSQVRDLEVDSVPINFLNPIKGTALEDATPLLPMECLKAVAVARLMMPTKTIRICGGREHNLRDLQSWLLISGADGLMVGGYLTTQGRSVIDDIKMIEDGGFEIARD